MKIAGFTFICNAIKNDYPVVEAIQSILPICDEFIVAVGKSEDETLSLINNIHSPKIKIIETIWDNSMHMGGQTFAIETDKAYAAISADIDWAFYIQGDEIVHEQYLDGIKKAMEDNLNNKNVEGLLFHYLHFYGSYDYIAVSRRWYRREIRIVRNDKNIHSYRDAQGFRIENRKLNVKLIDAYIYHYGWVKPPKGLENKVRNFNQFYHDEIWLQTNLSADFKFDYGNADRLSKFEGTHPQVMQNRIQAINWKFDADPTVLKKKTSLRRRILQKIEDWTGWRIGEYKNYSLIS